MSEICSSFDGAIDSRCLEIVEYCSEISSHVILSRLSEMVSHAASNAFWAGIGVFHLYTIA